MIINSKSKITKANFERRKIAVFKLCLVRLGIWSFIGFSTQISRIQKKLGKKYTDAYDCKKGSIPESVKEFILMTSMIKTIKAIKSEEESSELISTIFKIFRNEYDCTQYRKNNRKKEEKNEI